MEQTEIELQVQADEELDKQVISDFTEKRSSYPDWWNPIYQECKDHASFTLDGQILSTSEMNRFKFTNAIQQNLLLAYVNHEANTTLNTKYHAMVSPNGGG